MTANEIILGDVTVTRVKEYHGSVEVPTFPNATYLMTQRDFDYWNPANENEPLLGRGNQNVFEDSVAPVHHPGTHPARPC